MPTLSKKHRKTLAAVFTHPTPNTVRWRSVRALIEALGGTVSEREGSRAALILPREGHSPLVIVIHTPHPGDEMNRPTVRDVAQFITDAGLAPL